MSRHAVAPLTAAIMNKYDIVVGYDRALDSFFAQVEDTTRRDGDSLVVWLVQTDDLDQIAAAISPYGILPPGLRAQLEQEFRSKRHVRGSLWGEWPGQGDTSRPTAPAPAT